MHLTQSLSDVTTDENTLNKEILSKFKERISAEQILSYISDNSSDSSYSRAAAQLLNATENFNEPGIPPLVKVNAAPAKWDRFRSLQKWEGIVLSVSIDSFWARLIDLTENGPDEEAEFSLEELHSDERALVKPGAIFYWNIGYHDLYRGQRKRESIIRFRRLPAWTKREIDVAREKAANIRESIGWE